MDTIVVAVMALLAVGYLFWRFRAGVKGRDAPCGCGTCGCACGLDKGECRDCEPVITGGRKRIPD